MSSNIRQFPSQSAHQSTKLDFAQLLEVFDKPGPRYTSYPTIDHASESVGQDDYQSALSARALGGLRKPLSLYVHVPFCSQICYYCACNKVITKKRDSVASYLQWLETEAQWVAKHCNANGPVTQFHMGGGTPTFLTDEELKSLVASLQSLFHFVQGAEMSIEIDPRTVTEARLENLRAIGFNRVSFGVQDFDPVVQKAVHREQSVESVRRLVDASRRLGFESVNVDLIYGLPFQSAVSFERTLEQLVALSPDRVALYGYAHLPERFKPQRRINEADLPSAHERILLLDQAVKALTKAGYDYIGMDHFAKPTDSLARAKRQGILHRNFQGYTTQAETDLIGLGVSAISKVGPLMVQNSRDLAHYSDAIEQGRSAVFRGFMSERDDLIRQAAIMGLLCQGSINYADFEQNYWVEFEEYFASELSQLTVFVRSGLLELEPGGIHVTEKGWYFVRPIAMVFDHYLSQTRIQRSKVL